MDVVKAQRVRMKEGTARGLQEPVCGHLANLNGAASLLQLAQKPFGVKLGINRPSTNDGGWEMGMAESRAAEGLGDGPAPRRQQLLCSNAGMESERAECQWFLLSQLLEITLTSQVWHALSSILEPSEGSEQETLSVPKKFLA